MRREIVIYKNVHGQEMICHAKEYDDLWGELPGTQFVSRGFAELPDPGYVHAPDKPNRLGGWIGRVSERSACFSRCIKIPEGSASVTVPALPNMSTILYVDRVFDDHVGIWFHASNVAEGVRKFDKRYHFVRDGVFGPDAIGHVLNFDYCHTFQYLNSRWFIFPHVETAKPCPVEPIEPAYVRKSG